MDYPQKATKKRETLGNTKQNKTTRRAGYKNVYEKKKGKKKGKHSELKETYEMLNKTKNTNNNS